MRDVAGESRSVYIEDKPSAGRIERELARLRINADGTPCPQASALNLVVVTDEESAQDVSRIVHDLSGHHPSRTIVMVSDPGEPMANLEVGLSAFYIARSGSSQVCAEQITLHVEGPPAYHLEGFAGPLLVSDLPVFLWYPKGDVPHPSARLLSLADRLILDSATAEDCEAFIRSATDFLGDSGLPVVGDLQWAALSPWRSLVADLFAPAERAANLENIRRVEITHNRAARCQALLFAGWLSAALGWHPEPEGTEERAGGGHVFRLAGPSGGVTVELVPNAPDGPLSRVRIFSGELVFQVSRQGERADACSTVTRGGELVSERTVRLPSPDTVVLLIEELGVLGRDEAYETTLERAAEMLGL